jgi:hypothetical protein
MKTTQCVLSTMLPALALTAALWFTSQPTLAQNAPDSSRDSAAQQPTQPDDQNTASVKTFSGKIMKSGNKLILMDADAQTTYLLDDQQKAQPFLNKNVTVTGVLDASTGTIRVSAIKPAA